MLHVHEDKMYIKYKKKKKRKEEEDEINSRLYTDKEIENKQEECIEKYTSELWNSSRDTSFKKLIIKQPTKRPSGIISSWFLEMENMTSDKELKTNRIIRVHFNAFCRRKSNRSISIFSAFFHGISLTESGIIRVHN
jgi:hypothetical protein